MNICHQTQSMQIQIKPRKRYRSGQAGNSREKRVKRIMAIGTKERKQVNIRLTEPMKKAAEKEADIKGISFNDYVILAIREYLRHQKR